MLPSASRFAGSLDFRTDNQVVENVEMRIDRGLYVPADNVTFRNVKIVFTRALDSDFTMVNLNLNTGTVFENGVETEGPLVVEDNYIHDIYEAAGTDWHADGIQTPQSTGNITIRHNTIFGRDPATAAINVMGTLANPATNVLVEHNC